MSDFKFFQIPNTHSWVILDPKRANRPQDVDGKKVCPFCPDNLFEEHSEVFRVGGEKGDKNWDIIVIPNKYPFTNPHELVIHSREHKKFTDLSRDEIRLAITVYQQRYNINKEKGKVCIFANSGHDAGESVGHAHTQIAIVPSGVDIASPELEKDLSCYGECLAIGEFILMCPPYSQWPDEVWIVPKVRDNIFGDISYQEADSLSDILHRLIKIFNIRHEGDFPFNYFIYPYSDWYMRLIARAKVPGGFETSTGIFVNTQDPRETIVFIKDHFHEDDEKKINLRKAEYRRGV